MQESFGDSTKDCPVGDQENFYRTHLSFSCITEASQSQMLVFKEIFLYLAF